MRKKFQVFVSSTLSDLQDERRAVIEAILNLGHIPVGMEMFQAGNDDQWSYIKRRIDAADYYVVIVAERYGSEKDGVSYTEMEYDYAVSKKVPVSALLLREDMRKDWRAAKADLIDNPTKLNAFRAKCEARMANYWSNKDNLALVCSQTLSEHLTDELPGGWIPAKDAPSADVANELARLSRENEELREKLKGFDGDREVETAIEELSSRYVVTASGASLTECDIFRAVGREFIIGIEINESDIFQISMINFNKRTLVIGNPKAGDEFLNIFSIIENLLLIGVITKTTEIHNSCQYARFMFTDFGRTIYKNISRSTPISPNIRSAFV